MTRRESPSAEPSSRFRAEGRLAAAVRGLFLFVLLLVPVLPAAAGAEGAQSADVPPPGYERVSGAQQPEEVSPEPLVIAAYGLIWALVLGYVLLLWRRQRRVESEIEELRGSIERISKT